MKNFVQQSYRGNYCLPNPDHRFSTDENLLNISFSWGEINPFSEINDIISSYYSAAKNDIETTSPFEKFLSLSPFANTIRTSLLIANENVYRTHNKQAYNAGTEHTCIALNGSELVIAQIGQPHVLLVRNNKNILLTANTHLASMTQNIENPAPQLPNNLFGIESDCYPNFMNVRTEKNDLIFFYAGEYMPSNLLSLNLSSPMPTITKQLSQSKPQIPFWIGRVNLF